MPTSLNSLLGGIYTGPSGFSGFSGAGVSGFSGFSGAGVSGFSGFSGPSGFSGFSGVSGFSGTPGFNGGTVANPIIINNATATTSAGDGALEVIGGVGIGQNIAISGTIVKDDGTGLYVEAIPIKKYRLQTEVSVSSSTVANLSGFSFPLAVVGATYYFQFFIVYSGGTTATALGTALTFPAANAFAALQSTPAGTTGTAGLYTGALTVSGTKIQSLSVPAANTNYLGMVQGTITTSVSGTLQLQVSSTFTTTTTSTLTIKRGTMGWLWRIA